jgi:hypothetical protein
MHGRRSANDTISDHDLGNGVVLLGVLPLTEDFSFFQDAVFIWNSCDYDPLSAQPSDGVTVFQLTHQENSHGD